MTLDVLSVHQEPGAGYSPDPAPLVALLRSESSPVSLIHLHHFDGLGYLPLVWRQLLVALAARGHTLLVTTCSGFDQEALDFLCGQPILALRRHNQGRCLGAYRDTALLIHRLAADGVDVRQVLFLNDSVLPLGADAAAPADLEAVMALAEAAPAAALAGLTDSYARGYHLQSYCLCANGPLLSDPAWAAFWGSLEVQIPKQELIGSGEVGLSQAMARAGVRLLPLYPLIGRLLAHPAALADLAGLGDYSLERINPSLFLWRALREEGFAFVKKILMFAVPARLGGATSLHHFLADLPLPERERLATDLHHVLLSRHLASAAGGISGPPEAASPPLAEGAGSEASSQKPIREEPTRIEELRRYVSRTALGLEIGPFHRPVCPKREGFRCLSADILPRQQLLEAYAEDPEVIPLQQDVEEVDVLIPSGLLAGMADYCRAPQALVQRPEGALAYLISSHNLEHLPDPIAFLDDVAVLLADGGFLTMAIPVGSRCFDSCRPLSSTGQLIDAHVSGRRKPTLGTIFDHSSSFATQAGGATIGDQTYDLQQLTVAACGGRIDVATFEALQFSHEFGHVGEMHSFVFNPYSFLLIFEDLQACGFLSRLRLLDIIDRGGNEFIVHITKIPESACAPLPLSAERRTELVKLSITYAIDDLRFTLHPEIAT